MDKIFLLIIAVILLDALWHQVDLLPVFYKGVKEGLRLFQSLFPSLLAFMLMVRLLESSGLVGFFIEHVMSWVHWQLPSSILCLAMFRPVSGNAAMAFLIQVFEEFGPDSAMGFLASLMQGGTDTTLYVMNMYCSETNVQKNGKTVILCLFLDFLALSLAGLITFLRFQ